MDDLTEKTNELEEQVATLIKELVLEGTKLDNWTLTDIEEDNIKFIAGHIVSLIYNENTEELCEKEKTEYAMEVLDRFVNSLPREFWEDQDHVVGGYISKRDLKIRLEEFKKQLQEKR